MSPLAYASVGVLVGALFAAMWLTYVVIRPMRTARDQARSDARLLRAALSPFAARVSVSYRQRTRRWGWRCNLHDLIGGCFGHEKPRTSDVIDEARRHIANEHGTADHFRFARHIYERTANRYERRWSR